MASWGVWPFEACELPESLSSAGKTIDHLFFGIHALSMLILLGTGAAIGWVIWKFDHRRDPNRKAAYFNHNTKLEVLWTLVPAAILVALAFYQMSSWAENKMNRPMVTDVSGKAIPKPPLVLVKARQFGWEFHYAGDDGITETADDLYIENLLVVPVGEDIVLQLESRDVIHSFFVAELRLKQDIVPGKTQFAWFNPIRPCEVDILCTELCGWGHYKMKARLKVVPRNEFDTWLKELKQEYQPQELAGKDVPELHMEPSRMQPSLREGRSLGDGEGASLNSVAVSLKMSPLRTAATEFTRSKVGKGLQPSPSAEPPTLPEGGWQHATTENPSTSERQQP